MPDSLKSELYFVAGMMVLILVLSTVACVIFVRTYRKEMREKEERKLAKLQAKAGDASTEKEVAQ